MTTTLVFPTSRSAVPCYHGGAFFEAVGDEFQTLERLDSVISADVLDAWFPPSPRVVEAVRAYLPALLRTSPPTSGDGLARAIARARGIEPRNVLIGGGSSDLIFLALRQWLARDSRVLILDPMYGEYAHVLERVIGCKVDRLRLTRESNFVIDLERLIERVRATHYDLVVLVNPNSPTGQHVSHASLEAAIAEVPLRTRVWVDETYVDFVGRGESLERFATMRGNVVVCKSMSKAYALSGARVGYLCGTSTTIDALRGHNPPWAVSLIGQVAGVAALGDGRYYESRWAATHELRRELSSGLVELGMTVTPGVANFLLGFLPEAGPTARQLVEMARERDLFLRDVEGMGKSLGPFAVRVAVKDRETNERMLKILASIL